MPRSNQRQWVRVAAKVAIGEIEKRAIIGACETFIRDVLKPQFLPEIRPTQWNYVVDIKGAWAGGRYRFIQCYRSGRPDDAGEEFDAPFVRLERTAPDRFDIHWMRHTGKWWPLFHNLTLAEALHTIETNGILHPH